MTKRRGKNEGSIRKRSDGRWEARITVGATKTGNPKKLSVYGRTREDAARKLTALMYRHSTGQLPNPDRITVGEWLARWLEAKDRKPSTIGTYKNAIEKHIAPHLGGIRLQKLEAVHIQHLYDSLSISGNKAKIGKIGKKGLSSNSIRVVHAVLNDSLKKAKRLKLIPSNPAQDVELPEREDFKPTVWTVIQARKFLQHTTGHRWFALFYLALVTGMRRGELLGLRWEDIDNKEKALTVCRNYTLAEGKPTMQTPKTENSVRVIYLSAADLQVLEDHRAAQEAEAAISEVWLAPGYVFLTGIGSLIGPANLLREFKELALEAGVPVIRFHDLRHSSASLAIRHSIASKYAQERLGHGTTEFFEKTYVHSYDDEHRAAAATLSRIFARNEDDKDTA